MTYDSDDVKRIREIYDNTVYLMARAMGTFKLTLPVRRAKGLAPLSDIVSSFENNDEVEVIVNKVVQHIPATEHGYEVTINVSGKNVPFLQVTWYGYQLAEIIDASYGIDIIK